MRAREPDHSGYAVRSGVRIYYEVFGSGTPTILLLPSWAIVHSRIWKMQVPYLARHFRVVTFDPRGNGRSDRPAEPADYADTESMSDAVAVLDATGSADAVCVGFSKGAGTLLRLAVEHPERVAGAVFVSSAVSLAEGVSQSGDDPFEMVLPNDDGWSKFNADYWRRDWPGFAEFFFDQVFVEAHSTKQAEDCVSWATQTDAETMIATQRSPYLQQDGGNLPIAASLASRVRCPCFVAGGDRDRIVGLTGGQALAAALGCGIEVFHGAGHAPQARHPVRFNLMLRTFAESVATRKGSDARIGTEPDRLRGQ